MVQSNLELIHTSPFLRIKDGWQVRDQNLLELLKNFDFQTNYSNFEDPYHHKQAEPELYQQCFLQVVTETVCDYPHNAYGEKTFKPISCLRPFVILSVPGSLKDLQKLGFYTFSDWWSEDYDNISDPTERLFAVLDIINWIGTQDLSTLQKMLLDMMPILQHNHTHYFNTLVPQQILKFEINCKKNIKPR